MSEKTIFRFPNPVDAPSPTGPFFEKHGPNALDEIPSSRLAIADIIANWSATDATIRIFLIGKFGEDLKAASALVDLARADNFVSVLLPVVVSLQDRKDMAEAVHNFILVREKVKKFRDLLAHGIFASRSDLPGKILVAAGNPYRKDHLKIFQQMRQDPFQLNYELPFKVWSEEDFSRVRAIGCGLLNSAYALSVCFARNSNEIHLWRSAIEKDGLLPKPPWEM